MPPAAPLIPQTLLILLVELAHGLEKLRILSYQRPSAQIMQFVLEALFSRKGLDVRQKLVARVFGERVLELLVDADFALGGHIVVALFVCCRGRGRALGVVFGFLGVVVHLHAGRWEVTSVAKKW